jgi:hypothetical protein
MSIAASFSKGRSRCQQFWLAERITETANHAGDSPNAAVDYKRLLVASIASSEML